MTIGIGDKLGVHEILSLLGKGGMGEVYRARDSRLKRDVAIKILPPEFAGDPDRLLRFRREAEVLASLNHPNIGAIYDFQEAGNVQFLVMELVDGETLADRLQRGPLPVEEALGIAAHICDALDAAHEKGIIHRDLKPANISVTGDGRVKVLDFGLAKAMEPARVSGTMANSPTLSLTATHVGLILGTAAYMSPEQAKGFDVDRRSDIFSFGCVLYEMLTGRQAFQGDTVPEVLASVLVRDPDLTGLSPALSPRLVELIHRCLHKNPKRRWHAAGDIREEIEIITSNPRMAALQGDVAAPPRPLWKRAAPVVLTATLCSAIAAFAAWALKPDPVAATARFAIVLPDGQNFTRTRSQVSAISPDGTMVVYVANQQLYRRRIDELDPQPIPGTDGDVGTPFFSPDGRWIGFFSFAEGAIKKIPIGGGAAIPLCTGCTNTLGYGVSWKEGTIAFGRLGTEILRLSDTGGKATVWLAAGKSEFISSPQILPGNRLMFSVAKSASGWDAADVVVQTESGERRVIIPGGSGARYVDTGHLIYAVGANLFAIPFDLDEMKTTGDPAPVAQGLLRSQIELGPANFDVSTTGTLIYAVGSAAESAGLGVIAIADRTGKTSIVTGLPPAAYRSPRVSPDGRYVALETVDDGSISIYDLSGETRPRRLTLEGTNQAPVWSPDGRRLAFRSVRGGQVGVFVQDADGNTPAEQLTKSAQDFPQAWSRDDRIVFTREGRLWTYSLQTRTEQPMSDERGPSSGSQSSLSLSRDGQWAVYVETGGRPPGSRVFLRQFPTGARYPVSSELAAAPVWSGERDELFYFQSESRRLVSVRVQPPPKFTVSEPTEVPIQSMLQAESGFRQYDVMPSGRFLIVQPILEDGQVTQRRSQQVNVVLNWLDELPRIAPRRP